MHGLPCSVSCHWSGSSEGVGVVGGGGYGEGERGEWGGGRRRLTAHRVRVTRIADCFRDKVAVCSSTCGPLALLPTAVLPLTIHLAPSLNAPSPIKPPQPPPTHTPTPLVGAQGYHRFPLSKPVVGPNIALHTMPAYMYRASTYLVSAVGMWCSVFLGTGTTICYDIWGFSM